MAIDCLSTNTENQSVLYLHGWGCNRKYLQILDVNHKKYNSVFVDLPGFNEKITKPYKFEDYLSFLEKIIKEYKVCYIVGHSFGGKLAAYLLARNNCLKGITLISPSILHKRRGIIYHLKIWTYKFLKKILKFNKIADKMGSNDYKNCDNILKKTMSNIINYNDLDLLKKIEKPVIIVAGKQDDITPFLLEKKTCKLFLNSFLFALHGNHFAYINNSSIIKEIIRTQLDYEDS